MKTKVVLVFLAMVLVMSLAAFGACAAPKRSTMTPEEGRTLPEEEKAPPEEEKALVSFCSAVVDLNASPEGTNSARLTFTSTFTGDEAKIGTYDFRYSTEPITEANCLKLPPVLPQTSKGEPVPGADIFIEQEPDDEPIVADDDEGDEVIRIISRLKPDTTYYFVVWIINEPLESYDYDKEGDGDYKFTGVDISDEDYQQYMSNIASCTTPKSAPSISVDKVVSADGGATWVDEVEQNVCQNVQFRITIANDGDVPLINIGVSDALSGYLEYVQGTTSPTPDSTAPYLIWNFPGPVQPGDSIEITFSAHVASEGEKTNCVKVQAETDDGEVVNDEDCAVVIGLAEEEAVIEVAFRNVEAEPSVILELKKGGDVVLQVMETLLVEPTLTFYTAMWTPDLGQYYWYGYAEWNKEQPQYTFGFAMTAAAAPDIGNHNTSRSNKVGNVIISPDGDNIDWSDKGGYLGLMKKLCGAMEEIGPREDILCLLDSELPGSASELIATQESFLDMVSSSDYDEALAQMAKKLPYKGTEISNPGDVTYEELERLVQAIETSVIIMGTAVDLTCPNPLAWVCFATGNKGGFAIGGFNAA